MSTDNTQDSVAIVNDREICTKCQEKLRSPSDSSSGTSCTSSSVTTESKCLNWLEQWSINDTESVSEVTTCSSVTTETETSCLGDVECTELHGPLILNDSQLKMPEIEATSCQYGNVKVTDCTDTVVGNITKIYGNVYITNNTNVVSQQQITNQTLIQPTAIPRKLFILPRRSWIAEPPLEERQYLEKPAKYVIICHTASEEAFTQAENSFLVRQIQMFHVEGQKWSDIGYNFLVGGDGNVYEGRGWGVIGAHTYGYNDISLGIAFIGCFRNTLPSKYALSQAKCLIEAGVENGKIDKEYRLVSHSQCRPFESPGRKLHEHVQTWDHWYNLEVLEIS